MIFVCLDVEGVLLPEFWLKVADHYGIDDLRLTTREVPVYDDLMRHRISALDRHGLTYARLRPAIDGITALAGARAFLDRLRGRYQVALVSDSFYDFLMPQMAALGHPTLFCHHLEIEGGDGRIAGYRRRQEDQKPAVVAALQELNYSVIAAGDSFNDLGMIRTADRGILIHPPPAVTAACPEVPTVDSLEALADAIDGAAATLGPARFRGASG